MEFLSFLKQSGKLVMVIRSAISTNIYTPIKLSTWIYCEGSSHDIETWQESCANSLEVFLVRLKPDCSQCLIMAPH